MSFIGGFGVTVEAGEPGEWPALDMPVAEVEAAILRGPGGAE